MRLKSIGHILKDIRPCLNNIRLLLSTKFNRVIITMEHGLLKLQRVHLAQKLKQYNVSVTSQRLDIAQITIASPVHTSADDVLSKLKMDGAHVSKATVYNTLNLFCDKGLLKRVNVDPERQFYDSTTHHHHHLYNIDTGELIDIDKEKISIGFTFDAPHGTEYAGTDVVIKFRNKKV
jgi:Fur family transcriptional regulator, iron response regulator